MVLFFVDMSALIKRKKFTLEEKMKSLWEVNEGRKLNSVCPNVQCITYDAMILKDREIIIKLYEHYAICPRRKKLWLGDYRIVEESSALGSNKYILQDCRCLGPWYRQRSCPPDEYRWLCSHCWSTISFLRALQRILQGCAWWKNDCGCGCCQGVMERNIKRCFKKISP